MSAVDEDGRLVFRSRRAREITGVPDGESETYQDDSLKLRVFYPDGTPVGRDIARRHGGDLWAENRPGGGTVVRRWPGRRELSSGPGGRPRPRPI